MIVNGVDIFENIMKAISNYKAENYHNFGMYIGESFVELLLASPTTALQTKDAINAQASDFINGYFEMMELEGFNQQDLYNKIDEMHEEGLKEKMITLIHEAIMVLEQEKNYTPRFWEALHSYIVVFTEVINHLVDIDALPKEKREKMQEFV